MIRKSCSWFIFLFALVLVSFFTGCVHHTVEDFYFIEYSGLKRELIAEPGEQSENDNDLIPLNGKLSTPFYSLKKGLEIRDPGRSFFIVYSSDCPLVLRLKIDGEYLFADLPRVTGREVEFRYPLGRNAVFEGFQLETDEPQGSLKISGSGVEDYFTGADFTANPALIGHGIDILSDTESELTELVVNTRLEGLRQTGKLSIGMRAEGPGPLRLHFKGQGGQLRELELVRPENYSQVDLYASSLGFIPSSIALRGSNISVETFGLHQIPEDRSPLSMDFASILRYPQENWRKPEYELFRWSVVPEVLIFDFRNYTTQSAFLKRIAFFVEKDGYQGRLLTNQELENLHGWNAHDYRAEDLARFFTQAADTGFVLNPEEHELKGILLSEGILSRNGNNGYDHFNGAVISISRESIDYLRHLFLTHEGFHGLFFTDQGYRDHTKQLWDSFSDLEKAFWKEFLRWRGYDPDDTYLVQNELQAYLLQQPVSRANGYFVGHTLPRMARLYPVSAELVKELTAGYPNHFQDSAAFLEEYVFSAWGLRGGDLEDLKYLY
ncbi:hypothetical protein [Marispirochaeta sp.]|uniref:hypothetical protein n=1 Tax=Marispirochaeta sp. TaxID=2038653 RepID=UPI0029C7BA14|nr:hypothetical protein [Marispirochaeta sp.]